MEAVAIPAGQHERLARRLVAFMAAAVLVASVGGRAFAATTPKVSGGFTYDAVDDPSQPRSVTISAQGSGADVRGTFTWTRPSGVYGGPVSCLQVDGSDAWFAGPITSGPPRNNEGFPAVFTYLHDGGTPGSAGDYAFVWGADPGQTLSDMESLCAEMDTYLFGLWPFAVVSGDLKVR
jgi:hypothetical protein